MDAGALSRAPVVSLQRTPELPRVETEALKTDLPPSNSVLRAEETAASTPGTARSSDERNANVQAEQAEAQAIDRRLVRDPDTDSVIFQAVEEDSGRVKRQVPTDAFLNVRRYVQDTFEPSGIAPTVTKRA